MSKSRAIILQALCSISFIALLLHPAFADAGINDHDHDHHNDNTTTSANAPRFFGHIDAKTHFDSIYNADADEHEHHEHSHSGHSPHPHSSKNTNEIDEAYSHIHADLGIAFNDNFSVKSTVKLDGESAVGGHHNSGHASDGSNRFFDEHALFIQQLTVNYDAKHYSLYAGKFNPVVGMDYHDVPGIWTYHTLEEYAILERIGFGGAVKVDGASYGQHRVDVSTFFADTTPLSGSLLYDRGDTQKRDGGVSNTESFESFAVSVGGGKIINLKDIDYRVGFARQEQGKDDAEDEMRYSVSLGYNPKINDKLSARTFVEYMDISHIYGHKSHDRANVTTGAGLYHGPWNAALSYTYIDNTADDHAENEDGYIFQVSAGYRVQEGPFNGLGLDLGWKTQEEEAKQRQTVGALVSYTYDF